MGEIKQANFRIDEDAANAFRKYCDDHGWSQATGFDHVMEAVDFESLIADTPEREVELTEVQDSLDLVSRAYRESVRRASDAVNKATEKCAALIKQRDYRIEDLENRLKAAQAACMESDKAREAAELRVEAAQSQESVNRMLRDQVDELKNKLAKYDELAASVEAYRSENADLKGQLMAERAARAAEKEMMTLLVGSEVRSAYVSPVAAGTGDHDDGA